MSIDLTDKTVLVTGGTRGIGRQISLTLARAGARLVICYRADHAAAGDLARELDGTGGAHHIVQADVSRLTDIDLLVARCREHLGRLDAIVNAAGDIISRASFDDLSPADWRAALDTNLTACMFVVQRALPLLTPHASIVHVGSRAATVGVPLRTPYTAAKAGLTGLTRSMARELGPRGIRVNLVSPGPTVHSDNHLLPDALKGYERRVALGRLGRPDDVANVILFLVSDLAGFVSGETINVDGGA